MCRGARGDHGRMRAWRRDTAMIAPRPRRSRMRSRWSETRSFHTATLVLCSAAAFAAAGCGSDGSGSAKNESTPPESVTVRPWQVKIGARGGFTGGGSGYVLWSDGRVQAWSQITPSDSTTHQWVGNAELGTVAQLAVALTASDLQALKLQETGNMTGFLESVEAPRMQRWSWAEKGGDTPLPAPLRRAYDAALGVVQSAREAQAGREKTR